MGWFSDIGNSWDKALGMGDDGKKRPPGPIKMGIRQSVDAASKLIFDESGKPIVGDYIGPGQTTTGALGAIRERAFNDPLQKGAMDYYGNVLAGGTNPYLSAMYDKGAGKIRSQLDSQFASAGRYGGSDHELAMGGALGDYATNLYGGQYNSDMARMAEAARLGPDAGYAGLERQLNVGRTQDAMEEQARNWDYDEGMRKINEFLGLAGAVKGARPEPQQEGPDKFSQMMQLLTAGGAIAGAIPTGGASLAALPAAMPR